MMTVSFYARNLDEFARMTTLESEIGGMTFFKFLPGVNSRPLEVILQNKVQIFVSCNMTCILCDKTFVTFVFFYVLYSYYVILM